MTPTTPLSPRQRWRAIGAATAVFVVAYRLLLAGVVSAAPARPGSANRGSPSWPGWRWYRPCSVLAVLSDQDRPLRVVVKALAVAALVGVTTSAPASDGVTGIIAAVGAGAVALRLDAEQSQRARAVAVLVSIAYVYVLVRTGGPIALVPAPAPCSPASASPITWRNAGRATSLRSPDG